MVSIRRKILDKGEIVQEQLIRVLQKHEDALGDNATGDTAIAGKVSALETAVGDNSKGLTKKANDLERKGGTGILIEYGDYTPNLNEDEKNYVKNGYVIYRYGEQGGLRYYVHYFDEFKTTFCDIGYLCLDVSKENQITFSALIDKIAPKYENNWIQKNYNAVGILNKTLNCQTFTSFVLDFLRPSYDNRYITKGPSAPNEGNNESIIPITLKNKYNK